MPRSEEWSKKAWEWQEKILKNIKWSDEKGVLYTLDELMAFGTEWPKMIMPEQGLLGDGENVSFSCGEALVGLGVRNFKRITACPWEDCYNTSIEEMLKKATPKYIIPLTTVGEIRHASLVKILRIQSLDHVYTTMEDLWKFHPRYAMPKKTFTVGKVEVTKLQTIELRRHEKGCITCYLKDTDQTVAIPMSQRGDFTIVDDKTSYTLQQVYDNFNLPQRVRFERHPQGLLSTDVLLISETRYDVLIACVTAGLYVDDKDDERRESWGTRDEDFTDISFIFLPKPINDKSPLADTRFFTWQYDPNDPTCQVIMSRASAFELDRFKDMNVVIKANSASMSAVKECSAENIYDYIKVHDFIEGFSKPPLGISRTVSLDSTSAAPTTSWLHPSTAKAVANTYNEEPSRGLKTDSFAKKLKYGLQKIRPGVSTLKRHVSESDANRNKADHDEPHQPFRTPPRAVGYNVETLPRPKRQGPLPPVPNDGSNTEDGLYVQAPNYKTQTEQNISERARLPLPGEMVKKEDQGLAQTFPRAKFPAQDKNGLGAKKKESDVTANHGTTPRLPTDSSPAQQPPPRPPKPGQEQAVTQGQTSTVQTLIAAFKGQVVMGQGKSTATQGQEAVTEGQFSVSQVRTGVVKGRPTSVTPGGPRRIKFPPPDGNLTLLSELSSEQLAKLFEYFNLDKIAEQLKSNKVDGEFFENNLECEDFLGSPFFATEFQLKQIKRIRTGRY